MYDSYYTALNQFEALLVLLIRQSYSFNLEGKKKTRKLGERIKRSERSRRQEGKVCTMITGCPYPRSKVVNVHDVKALKDAFDKF